MPAGIPGSINSQCASGQLQVNIFLQRKCTDRARIPDNVWIGERHVRKTTMISFKVKMLCLLSIQDNPVTSARIKVIVGVGCVSWFGCVSCIHFRKITPDIHRPCCQISTMGVLRICRILPADPQDIGGFYHHQVSIAHPIRWVAISIMADIPRLVIIPIYIQLAAVQIHRAARLIDGSVNGQLMTIQIQRSALQIQISKGFHISTESCIYCIRNIRNH